MNHSTYKQRPTLKVSKWQNKVYTTWGTFFGKTPTQVYCTTYTVYQLSKIVFFYFFEHKATNVCVFETHLKFMATAIILQEQSTDLLITAADITEHATMNSRNFAEVVPLRQGCTNPGRQVAVATIFARCCLTYVGPQYDTCFASPLWRLEFWGSS